MPKVFCGGPEPLADAAAVMRLKLPADRLAQIRTINLFQPGDGDVIWFPTSGFSATTALINNQERNLAEYLQSIKADTRLPLVANYFGAMVNVSIKNLDAQNGRVDFYAPVVTGIEYKLASPVQDYVAEFEVKLTGIAPENVLFSCNCILNYLHSKLEGRRTGSLVGPVTFGEIAFQLLNQTVVYIEIVEVASSPGASNATTMELAAAHEEIQASEKRFRTLSDFAPIGIFLTGPDGRLVYENSRCQELSGVSTEDAIVGRSWLQNIHPKDLPGVIASLKQSERTGLDIDHEFRFVRPNGEIRWVRSRTAWLRSETGGITGQVRRAGQADGLAERTCRRPRLFHRRAPAGETRPRLSGKIGRMPGRGARDGPRGIAAARPKCAACQRNSDDAAKLGQVGRHERASQAD